MKIFLALLTSNNVPKLKRLVRSVINLKPVQSIKVEPVIIVNTLNDEYYSEVLDNNFPFKVVRTPSNGAPGKGKNSCNELFLDTDCDFVTQIDGDDFFYPTFLQSINQHVKHYPGLDVLGSIPLDVLSPFPGLGGYEFKIKDNLHAAVWNSSMGYPFGLDAGPNKSHIWDNEYPVSVDYIILQSRKSAKLKFNEELKVAEDHLYSYQLLAEHQRGNIQYFFTMSSDLFVQDRTNTNSVQHEYGFPSQAVEVLRREVSKILPEHRSSLKEIPFIYKELLIGLNEKEEWLKNFLLDYKR